LFSCVIVCAEACPGDDARGDVPKIIPHFQIPYVIPGTNRCFLKFLLLNFNNTASKSADLIDMITLLFLFALEVAIPAEMACVGIVQDSTVPMDLYIAAVEGEGSMTFASEGNIVYLNGPRVADLKIGAVQRVIRPEGIIHDPSTKSVLGTYYKNLGTIRIEAVEKDSAKAQVLVSCQEMTKGDLVVPGAKKQVVEFDDSLSDALTPIPQNGLVGSIILGKDDLKEIAAGHFCYVTLGGRDGIRIGDRLTVFRPYPGFNSKDLSSTGEGTNVSYSRIRNRMYNRDLSKLLNRRTLPPQILGDIIVVEAGSGISTGKVINSLQEMHPGDFVIKR
jgi:hypothetical protein